MIGKKIIEEKDITVSDVKNILTKRKKEGELSYEQKLSYDYSAEFGGLTVTRARELVDGLMKIEGLDSPTAVQIADNLPVDRDDLMVILEKRRKGLEDADIKKVLDLVAKAQK
ncbi:MAG: DNA-directed RNA polymerase subunit F [Candidatus Diapherotrites archaeon]|nr:DNA-directed RNA polymerase subunit F [Candidatus Diapherotrites archaeon]